MRVKTFDIGVESISRWQPRDEVHLPTESPRVPVFLPEPRPLDAVLRRPTLDERLPDLLQPQGVDADLLEPSTLTAVRGTLHTLFAERAEAASGVAREVFAHAAAILQADAAMDDEVRAALAMLLRG